MRLPALVEQRQTHLFPVVVSTVPVQHYHRAVLRPESHNNGSSGVLNRYGSNEARGVSRTRRRRVIGPSRTGASLEQDEIQFSFITRGWLCCNNLDTTP